MRRNKHNLIRAAAAKTFLPILLLAVLPPALLADFEWNAAEPRRVQQPVQEYFASTIPYSHVSGRYGAMGPGEREFVWQEGAVCTERLSAPWAGMWHLLVTPGAAADAGLDLRRCYGAWIEPRAQPRCLAVTVRAKGSGHFKIELEGPHDRLLRRMQVNLQKNDYREYRLPVEASELTDVRTLSWALDSHGPSIVRPAVTLFRLFSHFTRVSGRAKGDILLSCGLSASHG